MSALSDLKRITNKIPEITEYASTIYPGFKQKNNLTRGFLELCGRFACCCFQKGYQRNQPVHYIHDPRYRRFTPSGVGEFTTRCGSIPKLSDLDFFFAVTLLAYWIYISLLLFPRNLTLKKFLIHLTALDLACIWVLNRHRGVTHFYTTSHYQTLVFLISELRKANLVHRFSGIQHGAWGITNLREIKEDIPYDDYLLLEERSRKPFHQYFDRDYSVDVRVRPPSAGMQWKTYGKPHIAVALQNDDYPFDFQMAECCYKHAQKHNLDVIIYPHPHPIKGAATLKQFSQVGQVEARSRYGDSLCMVTRFSTLALEFASQGGASIFVESEEQLVFDTEGLNVHYTNLESLLKVLEEATGAGHK